jgi:phosphatidylserine/phosphatidylglycerophosphate/cardiolipin synthase-like enzyme
MWNGTFKKGTSVLNPQVMVGNVSFENYFCPEDHCADHVKEALKKAQKSIHFMVFSFTHEEIANVLMLKHLENVSVVGVMEAKQISDYSQYERLKYQGIDVLKDGNKYNLHHKVFIIDEKCVVAGSFNPSAGGDKSNDENVLIICDEKIAQRFEQEFEKIREEAEIAQSN